MGVRCAPIKETEPQEEYTVMDSSSGSQAPPRVASVDKRQYLNQSAGWLGVSVLTSRGDEISTSVPPGGTIWLSDEEAILTARAPARPEHNPFEEWDYLFVDADGKRVSQKVRPLVPISESRYVPSEDRFVPGVTDVAVADDAPTPDAPPADPLLPVETAADPVVDQSPPPVELAAGAPVVATQPAPQSTAPPAPGALDGERSWSDPDAPLTAEPQQGSLQGTDEPAPQAQPEMPAEGGPPAPVAPATPGSMAAAEETASAVADGEETGAAPIPVGNAVEGEFGIHEETGTPDPAGDADGADPAPAESA